MSYATTPTALTGVLILEPMVHHDARGFFVESFNQRDFDAAVPGGPWSFVQDNHSRSAKGVLRGLHFQRTRPQGKLVRVAQGRVWDVAVDIRRGSPTFGKWFGLELCDERQRMLWIPPGLAHGFVVLSESADLIYKVTDYYAPGDEGCLRWDDPELGVRWPDEIKSPLLSVKDLSGRSFSDMENSHLFPVY